MAMILKPILLGCVMCFSFLPAVAQSTENPSRSPTPASNSKSKLQAQPNGAKHAIVIPPEKAKPIVIPRFDKPPVIDGKLDDEVWKQAAVLKDFLQTQPGDNIAPSKPTEVMIGYDAKTLYFAFHCYDEPDKVRASVAKRDEIFSDDNARGFLDSFDDQQRAAVL